MNVPLEAWLLLGGALLVFVGIAVYSEVMDHIARKKREQAYRELRAFEKRMLGR